MAGKYPSNWDDIARQVKDEANWRCVRCDHPHDVEAGYMLTVHHIDMDKSNCKWWNLAALCQRCHLNIQARVKIGRVWMFEHSDWFKPYVAGFYGYLRGLLLTREEVMARLDELLEPPDPEEPVWCKDCGQRLFVEVDGRRPKYVTPENHRTKNNG